MTAALCGYLPYGLKGRVKSSAVDTIRVDANGFYDDVEFDVDVELEMVNVGSGEIFVDTVTDNADLRDHVMMSQQDGEPYMIEDFKPYLRSLTWITDTERRDLAEKNIMLAVSTTGVMTTGEGFDWLNEHHFDYRCMIDLGEAIEAPIGMYREALE